MRKSPASGIPGAAGIALVAALSAVVGLACGSSSHPIAKPDAGLGGGGGSAPSIDAPVDAAAGLNLQHGWRLDMDAANLLGRRHFELFGGSLIGRRILGSLVYAW